MIKLKYWQLIDAIIFFSRIKLVIVLCSMITLAQNVPEVVKDFEVYVQQKKADHRMEMLDIEKHIPGIKLDIRYATTNNFTGEVIYTKPKAYLRKPVADALRKVQDSLVSHGLGILVFDGYRPYTATVKFYEVFPNTNFVAHPSKGSRHNRGCAVDITLIDRKTGKELQMPTGFDEFSEKAHSQYMDLPPEAIRNRQFLFDIMDHFGFDHILTEWWHFDFRGWEKYPLMDISFEQLAEK